MSKSILITIFSIFVFSTLSFSQIPDRPKPQRLVNDYVGLLSQNEKNQLEAKLVKYGKQTTTQITVVIVEDLGGYDKATFTYELGEKWGVGQKGFDNGVVIMVKPYGGQGDKHTFIAVGYGLESVIPDAIAKRIIEVEMIPQFKLEKFNEGINSAVDIVMSLASKEFTPQEYQEQSAANPWGGIIMFIIIALVFVFSRFSSARSYGRTNNLPIWTALFLMSSGRHSGSYGNFNSGGGSFGGGGFGGFGGGGFGGGGAGGSW